jgi:hypothetical protein
MDLLSYGFAYRELFINPCRATHELPGHLDAFVFTDCVCKQIVYVMFVRFNRRHVCCHLLTYNENYVRLFCKEFVRCYGNTPTRTCIAMLHVSLINESTKI